MLGPLDLELLANRRAELEALRHERQASLDHLFGGDARDVLAVEMDAASREGEEPRVH